MEWTYDPQADAIYVALLREYTALAAVSLAGCEVILDVDSVTGMVAGIEVIGAGRVLPVLRGLLGEPEVLGSDAAPG